MKNFNTEITEYTEGKGFITLFLPLDLPQLDGQQSKPFFAYCLSRIRESEPQIPAGTLEVNYRKGFPDPR
jgi:hypothetical protein